MVRRIRLKVNKGKFVRLLWDRGYRTTVHAARFWTEPAAESETHRPEWVLKWNSPIGEFEAKICWHSPERPMLHIKRQGVIVKAEALTVSTLMLYKMIGGNENV